MLFSPRPAIMIALLAGTSCGCTTIANKIVACSELHHEKHMAKAEFMENCRSQKIDAIEHERDRLAAERAAMQEEYARSFEDQLKSKLAIDLSHKVDVSDLKVDVERLKGIVKDAEEAQAAHRQAWEKYESLQQEQYLEQMKAYTRSMLAKNEQDFATANGCCAPKTTCDCATPPPCIPQLPAYRPTAMPSTRIALAELPLVLEVKLDMESGRARIEEARTEQLPAKGTKTSCKPPCGSCPGCLTGEGCAPQPTGHLPYAPAGAIPPAPGPVPTPGVAPGAPPSPYGIQPAPASEMGRRKSENAYFRSSVQQANALFEEGMEDTGYRLSFPTEPIPQ